MCLAFWICFENCITSMRMPKMSPILKHVSRISVLHKIDKGMPCKVWTNLLAHTPGLVWVCCPRAAWYGAGWTAPTYKVCWNLTWRISWRLSWIKYAGRENSNERITPTSTKWRNWEVKESERRISSLCERKRHAHNQHVTGTSSGTSYISRGVDMGMSWL